MSAGGRERGYAKTPTEGSSDCPDEAILFSIVSQRIGRQWKVLGRALGLEDWKLDAISVDFKEYGIMEMAYETLRTWKQSAATEAPLSFLAMQLDEIGRRDLSDRILEMSTNQQEAHSVSQDEWLKQIKHKLHERYQKYVMKGLPWMSNSIITLADYYIDLSVTTKQGSNKEEKITEINEALKPVFSANIYPLRILVEGPPGYGKTTLSAKICFDHSHSKTYVSNFDLILRFSLRNFEGNLEAMVCKAAAISEASDKNNLLKIVNNPSNKVLMVLDGFDEVPKEHEKEIFSLLQAERFPHLAIVVTSRPGRFTFERWEKGSEKCGEESDLTIDWDKIWQSKIKILGLNKDSRKIFIEKHLAEFPPNITNGALDKLRQMEDNDIITSEFLECPLFLLMIILLLTDEKGRDIHSINTKTELYMHVFNFIVHRFCSKHKLLTNLEVDLFTVTEAPKPSYVDLLSQFGEFAIWALTEEKLSFSREEVIGFNKLRDPRILEIGLLTQSVFKVGFKEVVTYEPVHISLMEFAAAYSLWLQFHGGNRDIWAVKALQLMKHEFTSQSTCLPMLTGLMKQEVTSLLDVLKPYADYNVWEGWLKHGIVEIELTKSVLFSITPFLPRYWVDCNLRSSTSFEILLYHGIKEDKIKCVNLSNFLNTPMPNDVVIDKAIIHGIDDTVVNTHKFSCKHLVFYDSAVLRNFESYVSVSSTIKFETLSFVLTWNTSNLLCLLCNAITTGRLKGVSIQLICCLVKSDPPVELDLLTQVIQMERLKALTVTIQSHTTLQEQVNSLIRAASSSSQLKSLCLSLYSNQSLTIDMAQLCTGRNKTWECLCLREFSGEFSQQFDLACPVKCLSLPDSTVPEPLLHFLNVCQVTSLACSPRLLFKIGNFSVLHKHLTELNIFLDALLLNIKPAPLLYLQNLNVLILTMTSFKYQPLSFSVTDFLLGSDYFTRLNRIEIWEVNNCAELSLEFVNCISETLEGSDTAYSAYEGGETQSIHSSSNYFPPKMLLLKQFLLHSYHINDLIESLKAMKRHLINKHLCQLDFMFDDGCSSALLEIFSPAEGFTIETHLWGTSSKDSMQSRMEYDLKHPLCPELDLLIMPLYECYSVLFKENVQKM